MFPPNSDLWVLFAHMAPELRNRRRDARNYQVIGRLGPGVTVEQAQAELSGIGAALAQQYPDTNKDWSPWVRTWNETVNGRQIRLIFWSLMGAVAFVLLIACANVANLLLARAARPVAAGDTPRPVGFVGVGPHYFEALGLMLMRGRSLTESDGQPGQENVVVNQQFVAMHLSLGLALGLAGAVGVGRLLQSLLVQTSSTDPSTLLLIALVLVVVGLTASLLPARRATRIDPVVALRCE